MLQEESKKFVIFIKSNKTFVFLSFFLTLLTYGIKLFYFDYSIDTEDMLNDPIAKVETWQTLGRSGLVLFKKIFSMSYFNPYFSNFSTLINLFVFSIIFAYLFYRMGGTLFKKNVFLFVPILVITHPIMLEQLNFSLQNMEVSFGMIMICLSILLIFLYFEYKKIGLILCAIIINILSFSMYQSFIPFFIALSVFSFIIINLLKMKDNEKIDSKRNFTIITFYIVIFLISLISSFLFIKLVNLFINAPKSTYLSNQIRWGTEPFSTTIKRILEYEFFVFLPRNNLFYSYSFIISFVLLLIVTIKNCFAKKKNAFWILIGSISLYITPFLLLFIIGSREVYRAQVPTYPVVIALGFILASSQLSKKVYPLLLTVVSLIGYRQTLLTTNLAFSEHMKYQEDVQLTVRINSYLDQIGIGERKNYRLFVVGDYAPKNTSAIVGEVLGHSFYSWDFPGPFGVSKRATGFMNSQGYDFLPPIESDIETVNSVKDSMEIWPKENSVKIIDNLVVIKLSNNKP